MSNEIPGSGQPTPQGEVAAPPTDTQGAAPSNNIAQFDSLDYPMPQLENRETPTGGEGGGAAAPGSPGSPATGDAERNWAALRAEIEAAKAEKAALEARAKEFEADATEYRELKPKWTAAVQSYEQEIALKDEKIVRGMGQMQTLLEAQRAIAEKHGIDVSELPSIDVLKAAGEAALQGLLRQKAYQNMAKHDPERVAEIAAQRAVQMMTTQQQAPAAAPPAATPGHQPAPAAQSNFDAEYAATIREHPSLDTPELRGMAQKAAQAGIPPSVYLHPMLAARQMNIAQGKSAAMDSLPRVPAAHASGGGNPVVQQRMPDAPQDLDYWMDRMFTRQATQRQGR